MQERDNAVIVVHVKPGSSKGPLVVPSGDGSLTLYVRQRAVDGKANQAVVELLAKHLGVPKSCLEIVSGHTSRHKRVRTNPATL